MKLNEKILSIPPYISTSWRNVAALRKEGDDLIVVLKDGSAVAVPGLDNSTTKKLFELHTLAIDVKNDQKRGPLPFIGGLGGAAPEGGVDSLPPFRLGLAGSEGISAALQHNPDQSNAPDLPPEMLAKITQVAKIVIPNDPEALPKPEPHCNCVFCQIARAIGRGMLEDGEAPKTEEIETPLEDEHVSEEDLTFTEWNIQQVDDRLFTVTRKLDPVEQYRVFLGEPVGCTCGRQHCEHIVAVLRS